MKCCWIRPKLLILTGMGKIAVYDGNDGLND